jgi:large subunit ribosomal protein L32e
MPKNGPSSLALTPAIGVPKRKIIKKRRTHEDNFHSHQWVKVPNSWRKPKGIDGRQRRRFKGTGKEPKIGYGSNKRTRNILPNGFYQFMVSNVADVETLMMNNRKYCATIAHNVGRKTRLAICARAEQLNIRVTNANARVRAEESE